MITFEEAKTIAQKEYPDFPFYDITDIGDKWAFSYDSGDPPIPGIPFVCVNKANGDVDYLTVPPIDHLEIIEKGKVVEREVTS